MVQQLERAAHKMLAYPLAYAALHLPLCVYRLSGYAGRDLGQAYLIVCGSTWSLAGLVDIALYGVRPFSASETMRRIGSNF